MFMNDHVVQNILDPFLSRPPAGCLPSAFLGAAEWTQSGSVLASP